MKKTVKAEIKSSVKNALAQVVKHLELSKPSKNTRKAIARVEKALRDDLKSVMKKEIKRATKHDPSKEKVAIA